MGSCMGKKKDKAGDSRPVKGYGEGRPSVDSPLVHQVVNRDDFNKQLAAAEDKLVVVDFYASWCGPCKLVKPKYASLAEEFSPTGVVFLKLDVDAVEEVTNEYGISSMPTFVFIKKSKKLDEMTGVNTDRLKSLIQEYSSEKALATT